MKYTEYENKTIAEMMARINVDLFIPAIQRPYVWEVTQIERLFDSIMKEYPISTFLMWSPPIEQKGNWHTYRFAQDFKHGEVHNEEADLNALQRLTLVLDGQQRLTSLYIGLVGSYRIRPKFKRKHNDSSYVKQELYIDLLKNPDTNTSEDEVEGVTYGFEFLTETGLRNTQSHYWYKVGEILKVDDIDKMEDAVELASDEMSKLFVPDDKIRGACKNLRRLRTVIWEHRNISSCTVRQSSYDKVLDIFVRANDGGTKLSKSDLLMSLVTLNWRRHDARSELGDFETLINEGLPTRNDFNRDFILRSALLFCGQKYVFNVDSFTKENLLHIEENWERVKSSILMAVKLVNLFGLSNYKGNLSSNNSIMPIAFYVFRLLSQGKDEQVVKSVLRRNAQVIRAWLTMSLFSGTFAGAADSTVVKACRIVKESLTSDDAFPGFEIARSLTHRHQTAAPSDDRLDEFMMVGHGDRTFQICLQLAYDCVAWEGKAMLPTPVFPLETIMAQKPTGNPDSWAAEHKSLLNHLLLAADEREELKLLGFEEWLATRTSEQILWHSLPQPEANDFDDFCTGRSILISDRLSAALARPEFKESQIV